MCVLLLIILTFLSAGPTYGQISPGTLSRAHESLGGPLNCTKCHELGAGRGQLKCLTCHTEIGQRLTERRGMHAAWMTAKPTGKDCVTCHSEHNGTEFPLVHWKPNREALDHRQTGFALTGKHASIACASCHKTANLPATARATILVKDPNRTFLGLSRECGSCHADEHRKQLGAECARCHTTAGWKPASGFNHAATKFSLAGAHAALPCAQCHRSEGEAHSYVKYTGLAFGSCAGCHKDPHKGSFAATCESCHTTTSWARVAQLKGFDHAKTNFDLLGQHRTSACESCHRHGDFKAPIAHARCADCHQDVHNGQFRGLSARGDCGSCHTVNGFKPSTFDVKAHQDTSYPLDGRHAAVACEGCHLPKGRNTVFTTIQTRCKDCHMDIHKGQFAGAPHENRCEACHDVHGFRPAQFALVRHRETRFPLGGAHIAVPCVDCHTAATSGVLAHVKYRFEDRACPACHQDPHRGEFRDRMAVRRADGAPAGCEACHTTSRWTELAAFDHSMTSFGLVGAHRGVACIDCHRPPNLETRLRNVDYRSAPTECAGCHQDPHGGQFAARADAAACASCHNSARWKPAEFDHDRRTVFSLLGAHRQVACAGCHKLKRSVDGRAVVVYAPTSKECQACHGTAPAP